MGAVTSNWGEIPQVLQNKPWPALARTGAQMAQYGGTLALVGGTFATVDVSPACLGRGLSRAWPWGMGWAEQVQLGGGPWRGSWRQEAARRHGSDMASRLAQPPLPAVVARYSLRITLPLFRSCNRNTRVRPHHSPRAPSPLNPAVLCRECARQEGLGERLAGGGCCRPCAGAAR